MNLNETMVMRLRWPQLSDNTDQLSLKSHIFATYENKFAILTRNSLVVVESSTYLTLGNGQNNLTTLLLVHKLDEDFGIPSSVIWLSSSVLCIGFDTGMLLCASIDGSILLKFPCADGSVQSFKISTNTMEGLGSPTLWILYETGIFRIVIYLYYIH